MELFIVYGYQLSENSKFKIMLCNEKGFDFIINGSKKIFYFGVFLDKISSKDNISYLSNYRIFADEEMKYKYDELIRQLPNEKRELLIKNLGNPTEILVFVDWLFLVYSLFFVLFLL